MKIKFYFILFILSCLCLVITQSFAISKIIKDEPIWRSSINTKPQQVTINAQNNLFTLTLSIFSKRQSILKVSYRQNQNNSRNPSFLNFKLGKQVFTLKKQNTNIPYQANFNTALKTLELENFIQDLNTNKNAYITYDQDEFAFSLKGSSSIIASLLKYLEKYPMPDLRAVFNKVNTPSPPPIAWFNFPLEQNKLLYSMSFIFFLLLCSRLLFKVITYIYKKHRHNYRKNKAFKIATFQIEQNANILYIKRDQLLYTDEYGNLIEDEWIQEAYRFIHTKIKPILTKHHLLECYPQIKKATVKKILSIAKHHPEKKKTFFIKIKKSKIKYSSTMNPFDYEAYCAELLREEGWNADVTTASGDQGADVIAVKNYVTLIIQCKLYSKPVGNKAVQEVNAAKIFYHADYAAVVSNASYTISARQLAESTKIALLHHETLKQFSKKLV